MDLYNNPEYFIGNMGDIECSSMDSALGSLSFYFNEPGASVRYRLYSAWGLSTLKITKVVAFCSLTLWLGFFTISGLTFIFQPISIPEVLHLPFTTVHTLGAFLIAMVGAYLLLSVLRKRPLTIREWEFPLPSVGLLIAQSTIASLERRAPCGTSWNG